MREKLSSRNYPQTSLSLLADTRTDEQASDSNVASAVSLFLKLRWPNVVVTRKLSKLVIEVFDSKFGVFIVVRRHLVDLHLDCVVRLANEFVASICSATTRQAPDEKNVDR